MLELGIRIAPHFHVLHLLNKGSLLSAVQGCVHLTLQRMCSSLTLQKGCVHLYRGCVHLYREDVFISDATVTGSVVVF